MATPMEHSMIPSGYKFTSLISWSQLHCLYVLTNTLGATFVHIISIVSWVHCVFRVSRETPLPSWPSWARSDIGLHLSCGQESTHLIHSHLDAFSVVSLMSQMALLFCSLFTPNFLSAQMRDWLTNPLHPTSMGELHRILHSLLQHSIPALMTSAMTGVSWCPLAAAQNVLRRSCFLAGRARWSLGQATVEETGLTWEYILHRQYEISLSAASSHQVSAPCCGIPTVLLQRASSSPAQTFFKIRCHLSFIWNLS